MRLSGSFLTALLITWISVPTIVKISKYKKLYDMPNERTSHTDEVPNLGGLAVFAGFTLATILFTLNSDSDEIKYLLGSLVILFFIGIKDDILMIDPKKKLAGQIIASLIIICLGGVRITYLHPAAGAEGISLFAGLLFTLFVFVFLINGFNLIDGIDGLASGIGIIISAAYGIWFILTDHLTCGIISTSLAGTLIAFFRYNVLGSGNKIFLGDTGSLITGLIVAVLTVKFLEFELSAPAKFQFKAAPPVAIALLIIPVFDTLRVFILRLMNGKSPFKADRNHIHHLLLSLGLPHFCVTLIMISATILFVIISILLQSLGSLLIIIIMALLAVLFSFIPGIMLRCRKR